jgi:hypothetical protein
MGGDVRRVFSAAFALVLFLGGAAPKAVIEGPTTRRAGQSILLDARKSESDKPLKWSLVSHPGLPLLTFDSAPRKNTFAFLPDPDAGSYVFALTAVGKVDDELEADTAVVQVVVGGPAPGPTPIPPGPTPGPTPPPGSTPGQEPDPSPTPPTEKVAHATLVYDADRLATAVPAVRSSAAVRAAADRAGILWRAYDDDQAAVATAKLMDFVQRAGGVPAIVLQAKDGRVLGQQPCPADPAAVAEMFRTWGAN